MKPSKIISIIVASSPVLYLYLIIYETGYAHAFGYPATVFATDIGAVAQALPQLIFFMALILTVSQLAMLSWPYRGRWKAAYVLTIILFLFIFMLVQLITGRPQYYVAILASIIMSFLPRIYNWILIKSKRTVKANINEDYPRDREGNLIITFYDARSHVPRGTIARFLIDKFGFDPMIYLVLFFVLIPLLVGFTGYVTAKTSRDYYTYYIINSNYIDDQIVIRIRGNVAVSAPFLRETQQYIQAFRITEVTEIGERLRPIRVDNLRPLSY